MEAFGKFCLTMLLLTISFFLGGFVFMKMWDWFIVYSFGLKPLVFAEAIGLQCFISFIKLNFDKKKDEEKDEDKKLKKHFIKMSAYILGLLFMLLFAYIIVLCR